MTATFTILLVFQGFVGQVFHHQVPRAYIGSMYNPSQYTGDFGNVANKPAIEQVILSSAQFMMRCNDERTRLHLRPVDYSLALETSAQENNVHQVQLDRVGHFSQPRVRIAECVTKAASWQDAWNNFVREPSNNAVIVDPKAVRMGIACYRYYWTLTIETASDLGQPATHENSPPATQASNRARQHKPSRDSRIEIPPTSRSVDEPNLGPVGPSQPRIKKVPGVRVVNVQTAESVQTDDMLVHTVVPPLPGEHISLPPSGVSRGYEPH